MKPDWKDAPEWANWLAMDPDGDWMWFENRPTARNQWNSRGGQFRYVGVAAHWRETLSSRPVVSLIDSDTSPQTTTPQPEGQGDEGKRDA